MGKQRWLSGCFGACFHRYDSQSGQQHSSSTTQDFAKCSIGSKFTCQPANVQCASSAVSQTAWQGARLHALSWHDLQQQRFGGLEPTLLLVLDGAPVPHGHSSSNVAAFANAVAVAFLGFSGSERCTLTSEEIIHVLQKREPRFHDDLVAHLARLATPGSELYGLSVYFDGAAYASGNCGWTWVSAVASPCTVRKPRRQAQQPTTSYPELKGKAFHQLEADRSGVGPATEELAALLIKFTLPQQNVDGQLAVAGTAQTTTSPRHYRSPQLERAVLSGLTTFAVTAFAMSSGDVVFQNTASRLYWGDACPSTLGAATETTSVKGAGRPAGAPLGAAAVVSEVEEAAMAATEPLQRLSTEPSLAPLAVPSGNAAQTVAAAVAADALRANGCAAHVLSLAPLVAKAGACALTGQQDAAGRALDWGHGRGYGLMQQLFSLEPGKLERVLRDTCLEGRAWRGIVKVSSAPAPAATPPLQPPPPPPPPPPQPLELSAPAAVTAARQSTAESVQIDLLLGSFTMPCTDPGAKLHRLTSASSQQQQQQQQTGAGVARSVGSRLQYLSPRSQTLRSGGGGGATPFENGGPEYALLTSTGTQLETVAYCGDHGAGADPVGSVAGLTGDAPSLSFAGGSVLDRGVPYVEAAVGSVALGRHQSRRASLLSIDTDPLATSVWSMLSGEVTGGAAAAGVTRRGAATAHGDAALEGASSAPVQHYTSPGRGGLERGSDAGPGLLEAVTESAGPDGHSAASCGLHAEGRQPSPSGRVSEQPLNPASEPPPPPPPPPSRQPTKTSLGALAALRLRGMECASSFKRLELGSRSECCGSRRRTACDADSGHASPAVAWRALALARGSEADVTAARRRPPSCSQAHLPSPVVLTSRADTGRGTHHGDDADPDERSCHSACPSLPHTHRESSGSHQAVPASDASLRAATYNRQALESRRGLLPPYDVYPAPMARSCQSFTARTPSLSSVPRVVAFASSLRHAPQAPQPPQVLHPTATAAQSQSQSPSRTHSHSQPYILSVHQPQSQSQPHPQVCLASQPQPPPRSQVQPQPQESCGPRVQQPTSGSLGDSKGMHACLFDCLASSPLPAPPAARHPRGGVTEGTAAGGAGARSPLAPSSSAAASAAPAVSAARRQEVERTPEGGAATQPALAAAASEGGARAGEGAEQHGAGAEAEEDCWHEVTVTRATDPATGQSMLVVVQSDVTAKVVAERHIALVSETEHRLLEQIFPRHVLAYMTEEGGPWGAGGGGGGFGGGGGEASPERPASWRPLVHDINKLATCHSEVTLLFADIQGFTPMCKVLEPRVVMAFLNDLFTRFDARLDEFGVYKVETIGDCYFVAGGLVHEDADGMMAVRRGEDRLHAEKVFMFAKAMLAAASQVRLPTTGGPVRMRIGIHSGPVVSGVVGQRMPRFCLFGDTVNTTSRMESTGMPGCIHASDAAHALLRKEDWVPTGGIEVKGKGKMRTYIWAPPDSDLCPEAAATLARYSATAASNAGATPASHCANASVSALGSAGTSFAPQSAAHSRVGSEPGPAPGSGLNLGLGLGRTPVVYPTGSAPLASASVVQGSGGSAGTGTGTGSCVDASKAGERCDSAVALAKLLLVNGA